MRSGGPPLSALAILVLELQTRAVTNILCGCSAPLSWVADTLSSEPCVQPHKKNVT